ncbi:MAG: NADH-quinone oxidoreductase subunit J [Dehalococcoidales bacterium]|nr:NADH-quinone oxidoreductase subunit J [Dehalococcoidales bacterium]
MAQVFSFWILAMLAVATAIGVITVRNVFRTAMLLVGCFIAIAGIYILLKTDFLAAIQILIYVGAVSVLIVLAIMLTQEITHASLSNKFQLPALFIIAISLAGIIYAVINTDWHVSTVAPNLPIDTATTATIAERIFGPGGFILPLQLIPVILVATVISAIVLVKVKRD